MANPVVTLTKDAPKSTVAPKSAPSNAPIPKKVIDDPAIRERVNAPKGKLRFLGHGMYANVYDLGDGRVLKLTRDKKDAFAFANVLHRPSPAFAVTLDVFQLPGKPRIYGIVSEKLKPLGAKEEAEWNVFSALFFYRMIYPLTYQANGINSTWAKWVKKVLDMWTNHVVQVGWEQQDFRMWPFDEGLWMERFNPGVIDAINTANLIDDSKAKFLVQVAKALEHARIKWWDLHDQNIMRRGGGKRIVVADLGLSISPKVKIPVLGKSTGPRVFDVAAAAEKLEGEDQVVVAGDETLEELAEKVQLYASKLKPVTPKPITPKPMVNTLTANMQQAIRDHEDRTIFQFIDDAAKEAAFQRKVVQGTEKKPTKEAIFTSETLVVVED